MTSTWFPLAILAALTEAALLGLRFSWSPAGGAPQLLLYTLPTHTLYLVSVYTTLKITTESGGGGKRKLLIFLIGCAVLFRFTVWGMTPALSDDVYRYRWEGMLQAGGGNPYQSRPDDPALVHLRDATFPLIPMPGYKAGYGPLTEAVEWVTYRAVRPWVSDPFRQAFWFKAPAALFDLATILALIAWLRARGLPPERVVIYAWSPLPLIEFWWNGHNDAILIFFLALAFWAASRERWLPAFAALSLSVAAKIWPLFLFPLFIGWEKGRPARWWQWAAGLPLLFLLALPYWGDVEENVRFMTGFVGGWRNNDSLFGALLWLAGDARTARTAAFAIMAVGALALPFIRCSPEKSALRWIALMLLVSANCHPWYLTWILPLLAFHPWPPLLLWPALAPLFYGVLTEYKILGTWQGSTPFRWLVYGPLFGAMGGWALAQILLFRRSRHAKTAPSREQ